MSATIGFRTRDLQIARRLAEGLMIGEVAAEFGIKSESLQRNLRRRPELKRLVLEMQATIAQQIAQELGHRIVVDAPKSWKFLQDVRDGNLPMQAVKKTVIKDGVTTVTETMEPISPEQLRNRVMACRFMLDRQVPKQQHKTEDKTVRFVIGEQQKQDIEVALQQAGVVAGALAPPLEEDVA